MPSANIDLVRRTAEAFNAGSPLPEFWAEDAEVLPAAGFPEAALRRGREEIERFFDGLREGMADTTTVLGECEETGDKVLAPFEWRATGESSGVATTSEWFGVYTFRNGEIVRLEFFAERDSAVSAAGLE